MKNKNIAAAACLAALAVALGYVESLIPFPIPVPGIKLGLSNAAVLIALCKLNEKYAFAVAVIKVTVVCLLFAGFQSFIYSFSGGMKRFGDGACKKNKAFFNCRHKHCRGNIS